MAKLPTGTVTFLFTDIEGSIERWEKDRLEMAAAVEGHFLLINTAIQAHGGTRFKIVGDAVQAAFPTASQAVAAAVDAQRALLAERLNESNPFKVRMALHAGEALPDEHGDYIADPLNRLSRLIATGYGGQILVSQAVQQLCRGAIPSGVEFRDMGLHRLRDLLEPERIYQVMHPALPTNFPPLKTLENRLTNLPPQPTPFLGREREIAQLGRLLQHDHVRLVTLTGPGGIGKTRLALQAAAEHIEDFPDGVYFVSLASLSDPLLVPTAIAQVLNVRAEAGTGLTDALAAFLVEKRVLLVLDNFEHLSQAAPVVSGLLEVAPKLKVLTTSRANLHLRAEREYPVPPLGLPNRHPPPTLEQLSQFEAVRLFIQQAQAVKPDFVVDNESAPAIAEICWRLDGLPLAIELAAARIKLLPPVALLKRLERRLPMLMGGARDLPARQQTLRNTIAWSHDLLSPAEKTLFRRLAVFAGGCTYDAAEAVANADRTLDMFEGMSSLVDENLVRQEAGLQDEPRYLMLETIREYAAELLGESAETETVGEAHATWCLALAEQWPVEQRYRLEEEQIERLEADHDNLRGALTWFEEHEDWSRGLRLASAMGGFWFARAYPAEGREWLQRMLAHREKALPEVVADALRWEAVLSIFLGDLLAADAALVDALNAESVSEEDRYLHWTRFVQGLLAEYSGDDDTAESRYREALASARDNSDHGAVAIVLTCLGDCAYRRGDLREAAALTAEAASIARRGGFKFYLVFTLTTAGYAALASDELNSSIRLFGEALTYIGRVTSTFYTADTLAGMASVALAAGQPERATQLLAAVAAICEQTGLTVLGHVAQQQHAEALAREALSAEAFRAAWDTGREMSPDRAVNEARTLANDLLSSANNQYAP